MAADEGKLYTAEDIHENLQIPLRYLRKLLTTLSKSGLMTSMQGKDGGYLLAKKASEISLFDVVHVTENQQTEGMCFFGFKDCAFDIRCTMHDKWELVRENMNQVLRTTSLADLSNRETQGFLNKNSLFIKNN